MSWPKSIDTLTQLLIPLAPKQISNFNEKSARLKENTFDFIQVGFHLGSTSPHEGYKGELILDHSSFIQTYFL